MRIYSANIPPVLLGVLEAMRAPHEKSLAGAKMRLALRLNYNVQTIMHWCSRRRPIGEAAIWQLQDLHRELTGHDPK